MSTLINSFTPATLEAISFFGDEAKTASVRLGNSLTLGAGQMIAQNSSDQKWYAYDPTIIATPASAPTVVGNGSGSAYGAGTYTVEYSLETANGQTVPSPLANVIITAGQNLRVSAITSLATTVTRVNYFVNGVYAATTTPSAGTAAQTDITGAAPTGYRVRITTNTAYTAANGLHIARAILKNACATDANGKHYFSTSATSEWSQTLSGVPAYYSGVFRKGDLVGLDAKSIADVGARYITGGTTANEDLLRMP